MSILSICNECGGYAHDMFCGNCGDWVQEFWDMHEGDEEDE